MTGSARATVHATAVAVAGRGVLILGPSGAGKSGLALGVITTPFVDDGRWVTAQLIADDQVAIERIDGRLFASPPVAIAGKLEVRGLGIVPFPYLSGVAIGLVVELKVSRVIERLPDASARYELLGSELPVVAIDAAAPGAIARLYLAALRL